MKLKFISILIIFFVTKNDAFATLIRVSGDNWCPFTCQNSDSPGYIVEIGQKILSKKNILLEFNLQPWPKAVRESMVGKIDALAGASRPDGSHLVFPLEAQGIQKSCIWEGKKNTQLKDISNTEGLRGKRIGIVKGYSYGEPIDTILSSPALKKKSGIIFEEVVSENPTLQLQILSEQGNIDGFIESDAVLHMEAKIRGWETLPREVFCISPIEVYIAFSDKNKQANQMAFWLTQGMKDIRKSGELKKILEKYGVKDWK
jgi:polar amino acid transport system substrate-binding protein